MNPRERTRRPQHAPPRTASALLRRHLGGTLLHRRSVPPLVPPTLRPYKEKSPVRTSPASHFPGGSWMVPQVASNVSTVLPIYFNRAKEQPRVGASRERTRIPTAPPARTPAFGVGRRVDRAVLCLGPVPHRVNGSPSPPGPRPPSGSGRPLLPFFSVRPVQGGD